MVSSVVLLKGTESQCGEARLVHYCVTLCIMVFGVE